MKHSLKLQKTPNYTSLSDEERKVLLSKWYPHFSTVEIANVCDTYPNKINRDLRKFGIKISNKSNAAKQSFKKGREHPTKGKKRNKDTKKKISEGISNFWENASEEKRNNKKKTSKEVWNNMSVKSKERFKKNSALAIRDAAKSGSKLEKVLLEELIKKGYKVHFHKKRLIQNEKLHIDLFLPEEGIAIEVDGPSHFKPIWGKENLTKTQRADYEKDGLLLGAGYIIIRIKQEKSYSEGLKRNVLEKLFNTLSNIKDGKIHARKVLI